MGSIKNLYRATRFEDVGEVEPCAGASPARFELARSSWEEGHGRWSRRVLVQVEAATT